MFETVKYKSREERAEALMKMFRRSAKREEAGMHELIIKWKT